LSPPSISEPNQRSQAIDDFLSRFPSDEAEAAAEELRLEEVAELADRRNQHLECGLAGRKPRRRKPGRDASAANRDHHQSRLLDPRGSGAMTKITILNPRGPIVGGVAPSGLTLEPFVTVTGGMASVLPWPKEPPAHSLGAAAANDTAPADFASWSQADRDDWFAEKAKAYRERKQAEAEAEAKKQGEEDEEDAEAEPAPAGTQRKLPIEDFVAFSPDRTYIYRPDGASWTIAAVNARVARVRVPNRKKPIAASTWLDNNNAVEQRTWAPGEPQVIEGRLFLEGVIVVKKSARVFNLYKPPAIVRVTADDDVSFWQSHLYELWPDQAEHIEKWFAHRVQHPGEKVNHALLLTGPQGIGKDAVIEPLARAVGPWNVAEIAPPAVLGSFNEFVRSTVLRISEIKDLGDVDRFAFYEATKTLICAPPATLRCNPKHIKPYYVMNVTGVIMTSNYKVSGLYLPADDRRHLVAWSIKVAKDYDAVYWAEYWKRLNSGGAEAVAQHLRTMDLSEFDPKAPPPKTQAFWEIVDSLRTAEQSDMGDMVESLKKPAILAVAAIVEEAKRENRFHFAEFLEDSKNRRKVSIDLEEVGYQRLNNPRDDRGRWSFPRGWTVGRWNLPSGWRGNVYRRKDLTDREGFETVKKAGGG
jgi:hypothetical protein